MINEKGYDEQNLQRLASFLAYAEVDGVEFDMGYFHNKPDLDEEINHCGTAGCAVGWATLIWPKPLGIDFYDWSKQRFVLNGGVLWDWCFGGNWDEVDNTRLGAAKRIQYLLDHNGDLPKDSGYNKKTVALYADIIVKREHDQNVVGLPEDGRTKLLIADLIQRIEREPRFILEKSTG